MNKPSLKSTTGRAIAEIAIIIVGVLLAFQVENWRMERDSRDQEAAQLAALRTDFLENISRLREVIALQKSVVDAQSRLLRIANQLDPRPTESELGSVITEAQSFYRLKAVMGAYQSLVSSGDLRLLRNSELRAALAKFADTLGDGYDDEELGTLLRVQMFASMSKSINVLSTFSADYGGFEWLSELSLGPDFESLLGNQDYLNHIAILAVAERGQVRFYEDLLELANRILAILEAHD